MPQENQHYVPQLLLRGFLSQHGREAAKEQVRVLDLEALRDFPVSIRNIMAENHFNQWDVDEQTVATFEPAATEIESVAAPVINRVRATRQLLHTPEEHGMLAYFMAFQFIRTKSMRLLPVRLDAQLREALIKRGLNPDDCESPFELDAESLKQGHIRQQVNGIRQYADILADKVMFLMRAPAGSAFYLGDSPVVLHMEKEHRSPFRGLGIGVPYIQIYLPLSADLLLCAYDKAVLGGMLKASDEAMDMVRSKALAGVLNGQLDALRMKTILDQAKAFSPAEMLIEAINRGQPVQLTHDNVDHYNSLQVGQCQRFVVDPRGEFRVAKSIRLDPTWTKRDSTP